MDSNFFNRPKHDEFQKGIIARGFEPIKSEEELAFEAQIRKGEIDVVSSDDIKESFGGKFFKGEDVKAFEDQLEALIEKGQNDYLEQEEWDFLEKGREDMDALESVAVATPKGYARVFVMKAENGTERGAEVIED